MQEIISKLESGDLEKTTKTITLEWYDLLTNWHKAILEVDIDGSLINR